MSEHKHTPGPWRAGTPGPNGCYTVSTERGLMTAMVAHSINLPEQKEQAAANARLIAAAPELLEALEGLLRQVEQYDLPLSDPERIAARAAIARARGEA